MKEREQTRKLNKDVLGKTQIGKEFYLPFPNVTVEQSKLLFSAYAREKADKLEKSKPVDRLQEALSDKKFIATFKTETEERDFQDAARVSSSVHEFIFRTYLPVVDQAANAFARSTESLMQVGALSLHKAIDNYSHDDELGTFGKYSYGAIRKGMIDYLRGNGPLSRHDVWRSTEVDQITQDLRHELLREPSEKEVRAKMGNSTEDHKKRAFLVYSGGANAISLDGEEGASLHQVLPSKEVPVEQLVLDRMVPKREIIERAISDLTQQQKGLTQNEAYVLTSSLDGVSYSVLAKELGVSESRISQMMSIGRRKLKQNPDIRAEWFDSDEDLLPRDKCKKLLTELVRTTMTNKEIADAINSELGMKVSLPEVKRARKSSQG